MRLYQPKKGYRYTSDTIFLWNFIRTRNLKNGRNSAAKGLGGDVSKAERGESPACCAVEFNPRAICGDVLDVGAGCGILGLLLKRDFESINLSLLEIQERNLEILRLNSLQNDLPAEILHADFAEFKSEKRFDFIVSNPPFYRERISLSKEPHTALSKSASSLSLQSFIRSANSHLKPDGALIFCYDAGKIGKICEILAKLKLNLVRLGFVYPSCDKVAKLALIEARKNSRAQCEIIAPLYASAQGERTEQAHAIYKSADLTSVDYE